MQTKMDSKFKAPLFPVSRNGKWGAIDPSGQITIPLQFNYISKFDHELAVARNGKTSGILHSSGEFYPCPVYVGLGHRLFSYRKEPPEKVGLMDAGGQILTDPIYDCIGAASDGLIVVAAEGRWGAIDYAGNPRITLKYSGLEKFSSGLAAAMLGNGRHGYITSQDEIAVDFQYGSASHFSNGSAKVTDWNTGKKGFIDCSGKLFIPMVFDWAHSFSEGFAPAALERGKIGFIDMTGDWVIPPTLKAAAPFHEGLAGASTDWDEQECGFIDLSGTWTIPPIYNHLEHFEHGVCFVQGVDEITGETYSAYIDRQNQMIWGPGDSLW